jgi:hypothetical protein
MNFGAAVNRCCGRFVILAEWWRFIVGGGLKVRTSVKPGAIVGGLICALGACAAALADGAAPSAEHAAGVWQKHEYSFAFLGFTSTYSCDGLADKLKLLLIASGARADAKARAGACASGFGRPDKFARADLTFYTLSPSSAENSADAAAIDGIWKSVALAYQKPRELGRGDCELVEQFRSNVLPLFTARNIDNRTTCIPYQESGSEIDLKFEAFSAAPKAPPTVRPPA